MRAKNIKHLVESRIGEDRQKSANIAQELVLKHTIIGNGDVSSFFPELAGLQSRPANLPAGVPLIHQIVLGPPTVFDLEPLSPEQFEKRYRISIKTAEELAERMILIPNLYVRNPDRWDGMEHLSGLVKRALVNGERVDAYFRARDLRYESLIKIHAEHLEKSMIEVEKIGSERINSILLSSRSTREKMPSVIATRWAYLDIVAPFASEYVSQLVNDLRLEEALEFIRVTKQVYVSPISASIGGNFIWGPKDIAVYMEVDRGYSQSVSFPRETHYYQKPEQIDYIVRHITGVRPIRVLADNEAQKLIQLLDDRDIAKIKRQFFEAMDVMSQLAQRSEVDPKNVDDWCRLHNEIRKQIENRKKLQRSTTQVVCGFGTLINPCFGTAANSIVQAVAQNYADKVGETILQFTCPDRHRFFHVMEKINENSDS